MECGGLTPLWTRKLAYAPLPIHLPPHKKAPASRRTPNRSRTCEESQLALVDFKVTRYNPRPQLESHGVCHVVVFIRLKAPVGRAGGELWIL